MGSLRVSSCQPRPLALARHRDARIFNESTSNLSQAESDDDMPLSPIAFMRNEDYERSRLSYMPPPIPRPSSSPSSPSSLQSLSPASPIMFSQPNLSSPTLAWTPPPVFPSPGTQSLALRLKRPLPPLPKVDTYDIDSPATEDVDNKSRPERSASHGWSRPSPSSSDGRDNDSLNFSPATPIINPYISVTPASPGPPQTFPYLSAAAIWERKRTASTTSIVLPSPCEDQAPEPEREQRRESPRDEPPLPELPRSASPAPSVASIKSFTHSGKMTLRRIASKTRLFGRRTLSSASEPPTSWDSDEGEETIVGHMHSQNSHSFDDKLIRPAERARPDSPAMSTSTLASSASGSDKTSMDDRGARPVRTNRVEVVEATLTPQGDIWETRDLSDVIPKLRLLRLKM
ncbi:hypothetical protein C8Q80DRAFT_776976 [Daedaleopsis nitida]|nr:hypothetical protein C8Q80DRAFT_776976 [Daedaleopsis nitida]